MARSELSEGVQWVVVVVLGLARHRHDRARGRRCPALGLDRPPLMLIFRETPGMGRTSRTGLLGLRYSGKAGA
jgi:hypothetical protein